MGMIEKSGKNWESISGITPLQMTIQGLLICMKSQVNISVDGKQRPLK